MTVSKIQEKMIIILMLEASYKISVCRADFASLSWYTALHGKPVKENKMVCVKVVVTKIIVLADLSYGR